MSDTVPAVWVPEASVTESWELTTNTREASGDESIEIGPMPTGMVRSSRRPNASITLTLLPVQLPSWLRMLRWFTPAGQFPSAAYALVPSERSVTDVGVPLTRRALSLTGGLAALMLSALIPLIVPSPVLLT